MINCKNVFSKGLNMVNSGIDRLISSNNNTPPNNTCPYAKNTTPLLGDTNLLNGGNTCPFGKNQTFNPVNPNKGCDLWIYSEKTKSYEIHNKMPKNNRAVGLMKFAARKSFGLAKRIVPGLIMMTTAFTVGPMIRSCTGSAASSGSPSVNMVYEAGKQHVRDSVRIAELEQKIAQDSIRLTRTIDSLNIAKAAKHIK